MSYLACMEGVLYPTVRKTGTLEKAEVSGDAEVFDKVGAPGRDRTCDNQLRRLVLYPTELRARGYENIPSAYANHQASGSGQAGYGRGERI